jgi:hypothetical protein
MRPQCVVLVFDGAKPCAIEFFVDELIDLLAGAHLQKLIISLGVGANRLRGKIIEGESMISEFLLLLYAALRSAEIECLEEKGDSCYDGGEEILNGRMLGGDEDDRHEDDKDIRIDAEEFELYLIVDHLHSEVVVGVELVFYVVVG